MHGYYVPTIRLVTRDPALLKRTLAAVAVSSSLVLAVPVAAHAVVSDKPTGATPDFNGLVHTVVHRGDTVYAAGDFTSVRTTDGRQLARAGLAALSARTGQVLRWAPKVDGSVANLAAAKDGVYLVGNFTTVNGYKRVDVARVDPTTGAVDRAFKHSTNGVVNAVAMSKRKVYFGGQFTRFDGQRRGQLAAVSRKGESALRRWAPSSSEGQVTDLVRKRSGVYVAGFFHHLNGTNRSFLALVDSRRGAIVRSFRSRVPSVVLDISVTRKRVYAGTGGRYRGGGAVSVQRKDGSRVFHRRFDGDVQAITSMNGVVYAGGHFRSICKPGGEQTESGSCVGGEEAMRYRGASLTGSGRLTGWDPKLNPNVTDIPGIEAFSRFSGQGRLLVGGGFTTANGEDAQRFAAFASVGGN
ncbi:MAG: hypothetical protein AVDCRST_MAG24-736 [uncultured Nocardioidaceae bacterium]|uniref:PKD domain containing protein n=1 Tax=uncultured Nocardioidaceae bacterium TaxID=253824 RepID=A0A6J4LEJ3_9ACTN|nr:MAG: hypothetical protein AVDCRST_MAG24-736 [uncultured Nocardioidaceae bacterium]